jgi:hypothetical protein
MRTSLKPQRNLLRFCLTFALILPVQMPLGHAQTMPTALNIVVVEGEGAINNIRQRVSRDPIVRVEDENHKPIAGAAVVFTLPTEGATGEFGNGSKNLTVVTDDRGLAKAQGLKVNQSGGKLPIHVTASYRGLAATTTITQFVEVPPGAKVSSGGGHGKVIAILAAIGAAAAGGAVYAMQKNKSAATVVPTPTPGPTPIGITPGTGTIAPPR